jgi:hypothetical protein
MHECDDGAFSIVEVIYIRYSTVQHYNTVGPTYIAVVGYHNIKSPFSMFSRASRFLLVPVCVRADEPVLKLLCRCRMRLGDPM